MDDIIGKAGEGIVGIADDVVVYGVKMLRNIMRLYIGL